MYKIFISANQKELRKERLAVKGVINDSAALRDLFDIFLFEDLPAKGKSPITTYLKHVGQSDVYIGILGFEYGNKGKDGLSATEREFSRFLKDKPAGEKIIFIKGGSNEDTRRDQEIQDFLKMIKKDHIYKRFKNIEELKTRVLNSLISFLKEKGALSTGPFDKTVRKDLGYDSIDEGAVRDFLENREIKLNVATPKISIKEILVKTLKIVVEEEGKFYPTNTALLFFGKNPSEHISHHEIRIARFKGTDRIQFIDSQEIKGPIYKMLADVKAFFLRNTRLANKIVEFKRVNIPEYPFEAIREAVINAIAHRDYKRRGAPIMAAIFDDRVEVSNAGGLLPGLNIKHLEGHHVSRNEEICKIFHETLDMERFGTGVRKMKDLMHRHGLSGPEFSEEGDFFVAKFYGPGEKILGLVSDIPPERQTDLKALGLNERQIEALRLMVNDKHIFSNSGYRDKFKVSNQTFVRDMKELLKVGLVVTTGSGRSLRYSAK